jgi:superfamily I DNA and/or RNA helicase
VPSTTLSSRSISGERKEFRYVERNREARIKYYQDLRELIKRSGSESLVFIDEAGFETSPICIHAFAKKGKKFLEIDQENVAKG